MRHDTGTVECMVIIALTCPRHAQREGIGVLGTWTDVSRAEMARICMSGWSDMLLHGRPAKALRAVKCRMR